MARYYRRRYTRTIVRAPKKKWCSNIRQVLLSAANPGQEVASVSTYAPLAENKSETTGPTPVIIKTGNFKFQGDYYVSFTSGTVNTQIAATGQLYIVYAPEGINVNTLTNAQNIVNNHPEWIIAWRYFDITQGPLTAGTLSDGGRVSVTSRLKRNLNTGDKIYAIVIADSMPVNSVIVVRGMCQFWTCAN